MFVKEIMENNTMEHKVALCIPTYERSEIVRDFLTRCSSYYFQEGIDIYYYDSSVSDETESLIKNWPESDRLFYIRFSPEVGADEKAGLIYQCQGLKYEYDFIWLSNDSYQILPNTLHSIMNNLLPEYDIINITPQKQDYDHCGLRVFTNHEDYIWACLYNIGRFGNAIVNRKTMLDGLNWDIYMDLFVSEDIHAFGNFLFYFFRLSELDNMRALYMPLNGSDLRDSNLKLASNWKGSQFDVWCGFWVKGIEALPDSYRNKDAIIYKFTSTMCMHDLRDFLRYRIEKVYNYNVYKKYKDVWPKVTHTPSMLLFLTSILPIGLIMFPKRIIKKIRKIGFDKFYKNHSRIFIYGASAGGFHYDLYLKKLGYSYDGFCCSKRMPKETDFCGHKIYELNELEDDLHNIGFIVAMQDENFERVKPMFEKLKCNYYRNCYFESDISFELGYRGASWYIGKIR